MIHDCISVFEPGIKLYVYKYEVHEKLRDYTRTWYSDQPTVYGMKPQYAVTIKAVKAA